jgi:hypothetical protein
VRPAVPTTCRLLLLGALIATGGCRWLAAYDHAPPSPPDAAADASHDILPTDLPVPDRPPPTPDRSLAVDAGPPVCVQRAAPDDALIRQLWIAADGRRYAASDQQLYEFQAGKWSSLDIPFTGSSAGDIVGLVGDDRRIAVVSEQGSVYLRSRLDGSTARPPLPATNAIGIALLRQRPPKEPATDHLFVASAGELYRANFSGELTLAGPLTGLSAKLLAGETLSAIWSDGDAIVVAGASGSEGVVARYQAAGAGDWQYKERVAGKIWRVGWGDSGDQVVLAANEAGRSYNTNWFYRAFKAGTPTAIWGRTASDVFAFAPKGHFWHYGSAGEWRQLDELGGYKPALKDNYTAAHGRDLLLVVAVERDGKGQLLECTLH